MGLFDFWKKKDKKEIPAEISSGKNEPKSKLLLAMPIFVNNQSYRLDEVISHLRSYWGLKVDDLAGDDETATFNINDTMVALATMPVPIPKEELDGVIPYTYIWRNAAEELEKQTAHAIVTVMGDNGTQIERYTILSKLLSSILMTTEDCIGVYQGSETLLLQKEYYLAAIDDLKNGRIPVPAWVYIGLRPSGDLFDSYTYGMDKFDKPEIEIIGSKLELDNLYKLMLSISSYIIGFDVLFKDGDMYKLTDTVSVKLSVSAGVYVEGMTLKVDA